ncbi:MAG TPA: helix-turn-helix transcriptional regulator [Chloroflexota bacterium]|nr:helix-turn-helix transcriptional regulator [Chloroflexota bacterium]
MAIVIPLKSWREARLLTQQELSVRAGVSEAAIVRIEKGNPARISTVRKLLGALDMNASVLEGLQHGNEASGA